MRVVFVFVCSCTDVGAGQLPYNGAPVIPAGLDGQRTRFILKSYSVQMF